MVSLSVEGSFSSAVITFGGNEPGLEGVFFMLVGELYVSGFLTVNGDAGGGLAGCGSGLGFQLWCLSFYLRWFSFQFSLLIFFGVGQQMSGRCGSR